MTKRQWTSDQQNAITARNGAVLVSAAAGSGKTAVLVERVIQILTDKERPCDADRLLIVTFTKAAAAEMKERITTRISEMLMAEPSNKNLQRQQLMLANAHISTIHSFCNELIRENFFKLNISPEFRIADENEMLLLRDEAMQLTLEERYTARSQEFLVLVETISSGRNDQKLIDTVFRLYEFIRAHPFLEKWLDDKLKLYDEPKNVNETAFAQILLNYARMSLRHCLALMENSLRIIQSVEKIKLAYEETLLDDKKLICDLQLVFECESWDKISSALKLAKFSTLKRLTGYSDDQTKQLVLQNRQKVKDIVKSLTKLFFLNEAQCLEDLSMLRPIIAELFAFVRDFSRQLDVLKLERNVVDFGDLEHLTLKLLVQQSESGFEKTELARSLSQQFDFVMVDEYQDTNEAQDLIFRALSDDERNLFVVGDVKQSIYGFRQAMPEIFLRRKKKYQLFDANNEAYPAKIILGKNFRSRAGILGATNFIFSQLMSTSMGEIEYSREERLALGADYLDKDEADVEMAVLDISGAAGESMNVFEARYIAERIAQMVGEKYQVKDKNATRAATYGDFCILLRSANKHAPEFVKELERCGIPAWSDTSNSFFGTVEIATMLSLLKIIDNPIQDVPLLAVLLSPMFGFTPDDLSEIRVVDKSVPMYFALKKHAELGHEKCEKFLHELSCYRRLASTLPSDKLIQHIYEKTSYVAIVQAMRDGHLRLNNLRLLLEYARNYEASGYKGLAGFIRFIERLEEQKADLSSSNSLFDGANVVKVMSIHRSKGLEFPVCFLANCSRKFNKDVGEILLHPELGPAVKLLDRKLMRNYTTFQRDAVKLDLDKKAMSEELRVLYVAMTRAKEKLVMVSALKNPESTLKRLGAQVTDDAVVSPFVVSSASSFSDWLLMCALRHPSGSKLRDIAEVLPEVVVRDETSIYIDVIKPQREQFAKEKSPLVPGEKIIDETFLEKINSRINFVYKYEALAKIPAKVTVSELISGGLQEVKFDFSKRPVFLSGVRKLEPAQRGTALHAFMQFAELQRAQFDLESEIKLLQERGFLSKEQADVLDRVQIRRFLSSELCARILASPSVVREWRFAVNINAAEVVPGLSSEFSSEKIILQGAVDCVFEENCELVIVDYKTDKTTSEQVLREQYGKQLTLYSRALRECTGKNIAQKVLYSFYTGRVFFF